MIKASVDTRELEAFHETLARYLQLNRRDVGEITRRKGNDLRIALYDAFSAHAPAKGTSLHEAKGRGWRLRRRGAIEGLSATAHRRARARLGGHDSILVSSVSEADGRIVLRGVRASKTGQRRILGGRNNRGGQAVSGRNRKLRQSTDRVLNARALAVIEELNLRERARRVSAVGWLAGQKALRRNIQGQRVVEIVRNRTGSRLGDMTWDNDGNVASIQFMNRMGAAQAVASRGAVSVALRAANRDMRSYIDRKVQATIAESGVAR